MRHAFDCFDFCQWTLGKHYNFSEFMIPWGAVLLPADLETLIDDSQK
jgi:hypothetical protein